MEHTINIMGGEVYIYFSLKDKKYEEDVLKFITNEITFLVNIFNFYDKNSLLSQLNNQREIKFDENLNFLLKESIKIYEISNGMFNIFIGENIQKRKENCYMESISVFSKFFIITNNNKIKLTNDKVLIDMGGIAKGYILDEVLSKTLNKFKNYLKDILIDARGDIVSYGNLKKTLVVENPFNNSLNFEEISLKTGSIVTSGHNRQYFKYGSHIIGKESEILTITLISKTKKCYELDSLATYLIQLTSNNVLNKIEFEYYFKDIECLMILKNGKVLKSSFWDTFK